MSRGGVKVVALAFAIVVTAGQSPVAAWAQPATQPAAQIPACGDPTKVDPATNQPFRRAELTLRGGARTTRALGRNRGPQELQFQYDVAGCEFRGSIGGTLKANFSPIETESGTRVQKGKGSASGTIEGQRLVTLQLNFEPRGDAPAGRYTTTVFFVDPAVDTASAVVTLTLQFPQAALLAFTVFPAALVVGWVVVWSKGKLMGARDGALAWWAKLGNLFGVVAGLVAARAAWGTTYLKNSTFGGDMPRWNVLSWILTSEDWLSLVSVVTTAFVGALTAATLAGDRVRGGVDTPSEGGPIRRTMARRQEVSATPPPATS